MQTLTGHSLPIKFYELIRYIVSAKFCKLIARKTVCDF